MENEFDAPINGGGQAVPGADSGFRKKVFVTSQRLGSATLPDINELFNHLYHRTEVYVSESTVLENLN